MKKTSQISLQFLWSCLLVYHISIGCSVDSDVNQEKSALLGFKSGIADRSSSLSSWNENATSACYLNLVTCDRISGRVSELSLDGLGLSGKIGGGLEKLSHLQSLSLACNNFTGGISTSITLITTLIRLDLRSNSLSGEIPYKLSKISSIEVLDLSENSLTGAIPDHLLGSFSSLRNLDLSHNQLSGTLPEDVGQCRNLVRLDLRGNLFVGSLPDSLQKLTSLEFLNLSDNGLSGEFPLWIGSLSSLRTLDLAKNEFTGTVPYSVAYCSKLSEIRLSGNEFSGSIPNGLFDLGLQKIDLSSNAFDGTIPPGTPKLYVSLTFLDLSNNRLTGEIPVEIFFCFKIVYMSLAMNKLNSSLPQELGHFRNLSVLDLRGNAFGGSIPKDLCYYSSLTVLQLDGNFLTGLIPQQIGNCRHLYSLGLSHNNLNGTIPEELSNLKELKILNLEVNRLSGEIPPQLGDLKNLVAVNVSHNRLVGRLPDGNVFSELDKSALEGNLGLCSHLLKTCLMNISKPMVLNPGRYYPGSGDDQAREHKPHMDPGHRRFLSISAIIAISAATAIAIGVVIVALLSISAQKGVASVDKAMESRCSSSSRSGCHPHPIGRFILFNPTSDFGYSDWGINPELALDKATEIGRGALGIVYKVSFGEGKVAAIKKLVSSSIIPDKAYFDREVQILGRAKHPNLMPLRGYYWTPQLQLLISNYAPNGSLQASLHNASSSTPPLSWANRFKIALGTAKGLAHLHHSIRPAIIHSNFKSSNVLLDENHSPWISDFGLTRLIPKPRKHVFSGGFQTALGYVAPEMSCQSLKINEKSDVYGFGVMILELVTGRKPVEYGDDDVVVLSDYVRVKMEQGNVLDCADPRMGDYPEEEVLPVLKLGLVCTSQVPSSRPSMLEVVQILQVIKTPLPETMEAY